MYVYDVMPWDLGWVERGSINYLTFKKLKKQYILA